MKMETHLSLQNRNLEVTRKILKFLEETKEDAKEAVMQENKFGWTPFSGAVSTGDMENSQAMCKYITDMASFVDKPDLRDMCPLHLAAKFGHVNIFEYLLEKKADITKRGPLNKTALDIAIEEEQRRIIQFVIKSEHWKTAF